jgi:hypothetical protein
VLLVEVCGVGWVEALVAGGDLVDDLGHVVGRIPPVRISSRLDPNQTSDGQDLPI